MIAFSRKKAWRLRFIVRGPDLGKGGTVGKKVGLRLSEGAPRKSFQKGKKRPEELESD